MFVINQPEITPDAPDYTIGTDGSEGREEQLIEQNESTIIWHDDASALEVRCDARVLAEIAEAAMSGYRRYPWGGVEIGGVLFGRAEQGTVQIFSFRPAVCEHHYGPAFELSENDQPGFENLLNAASSDVALVRLKPVGFYQTISRNELSLSEHSRGTFQRYFPEAWQIAMVVKRSKRDPLSVGIFARSSRGGVELHSPPQEFALDGSQQPQPVAPEPPPLPQSPAFVDAPGFLELPSIFPGLRDSQPKAPLPPHEQKAVREMPTVLKSPVNVTPPPIPLEPSAPQKAPALNHEQNAIVEKPTVLNSPVIVEPPPIQPESPARQKEPAPSHEQSAIVEKPAVLKSPVNVEPPPIQPEIPAPQLEEPSDNLDTTQELPAIEITTTDSPVRVYGVREDPFSIAPDARFFYPSPQHREALSVLFHQIRCRAGFMAVVGAPGTGKSIVLECLGDLLNSSDTEFAYLLSSKVTVPEFFEMVTHDLGLPYAGSTKTAMVIALNEYLLERSCAGLTTALIVDNAQKLSTEVLEEIELLGNLENRSGRLLQVVFAAQPGFERQLDVPELRGLKQRLMMWARLEPFDSTQTASYIEHRMGKAGAADLEIFPPDVVAEIHRNTGGVPRLINALCARLLEVCGDLQINTANADMVRQLANELMLSGFDDSRSSRLHKAAHWQ